MVSISSEIEATKGEILETLMFQLKVLNKQRLVKKETLEKQMNKGTILENESSLISNSLCLHNILNSQIGEETNNNKSSMANMSSCL